MVLCPKDHAFLILPPSKEILSPLGPNHKRGTESYSVNLGYLCRGGEKRTGSFKELTHLLQNNLSQFLLMVNCYQLNLMCWVSLSSLLNGRAFSGVLLWWWSHFFVYLPMHSMSKVVAWPVTQGANACVRNGHVLLAVSNPAPHVLAQQGPVGWG